jgi:hypothetical protein
MLAIERLVKILNIRAQFDREIPAKNALLPIF